MREVLALARKTVSYEPESGTFRWLIDRSSNAKAGSVAGSISGKGYRYIRVGGVQYRGNRLAWLLMTGGWPKGVVDHINGVRSDDRWANLRLAPATLNNANSKLRSDNSSGSKGVRKVRSRWQVRLGQGGKAHVGTFDTIEEAKAAYKAAADARFGPFARLT